MVPLPPAAFPSISPMFLDIPQLQLTQAAQAAGAALSAAGYTPAQIAGSCAGRLEVYSVLALIKAGYPGVPASAVLSTLTAAGYGHDVASQAMAFLYLYYL
ncbi:MAG: hypothetical protein ACREKH_03830, partial [Candidatus Rokuibacteriota bacterium]